MILVRCVIVSSRGGEPQESAVAACILIVADAVRLWAAIAIESHEIAAAESIRIVEAVMAVVRQVLASRVSANPEAT